MIESIHILTCVTNALGKGPGHTAISIGETVYSFENAGDWFSSFSNEKSGWKEFQKPKYLKDNAHRPVILQKISNKVDPQKAKKYIKSSIAGDDDYLSSGVCSSQVANAIDAAWSSRFNPWGVDTPHKVFWLAKNLGIVTKTSTSWAGKGDLSFVVRALIQTKLLTDYPGVSA